jgi:hypothetical protein
MTTVVTARHGDAPIDGDDERPAQLGFRLERNLEEEGKNPELGFVLGFI